ncbi:Fic family protein [Alteromonas sp. NFXS44]|uniref:Fic family protein n=1 Tax=Alteromonas sp. NFXS44 TaxID=2818435 RepID=UPI0032DE5096
MFELYFPKDTAESKALSKKFVAGTLKRIRQGIYTNAPYEEINDLVIRQWSKIVNYLYPNAIASHSTAEHLKPVDGTVYITADIKVRKSVKIADSLTINIIPGNVNTLTEHFLPELFRSAPARMLLENLQIAHGDTSALKSLGKVWVEEKLCTYLDRYGEDELNRIRDMANKSASTLDMQREAKLLDSIVSSILTTQPIKNLASRRAIAHAKKEPFDTHRITIFQALADYLQRCEFTPSPYQYDTQGWLSLSFYESYFSNYIEGTEFEIDEAEKIIFEKKTINNRHQDSHDVLSVFDVVNDYSEMCVVPSSTEELINLLKERHALIMSQRPEKRPGEFKTEPNKAGGTSFVVPEHVEGTFAQAFPIYQSLPAGLPRAIFMQFLVAEVHPHDDGNGRLSRIMLNAELVANEEHKIIIPTVHRESYLNGHRQATRSGRFRTLVKVFANMQAYTASIEWSDYGEARETLERHMADKLPDQGIATFNREISKHKITLPAG